MNALDLFAGGGGTTTGAESVGLRVIAAVNHKPIAVETHRANHPHVRHYCESIEAVDPRDLDDHDVMLASPECDGWTRGRGKDQPRHAVARATAAQVHRFLKIRRTRLSVTENVVEFLQSAEYPAWRRKLSELGYRVTEVVIDAADCGVPQNRRRAFVVASLGPLPVIRQPRAPHRPVADVLDLSGEGMDWSPVEGHCAVTVRQAAAGRAEHGSRPFLLPYYKSARTAPIPRTRSVDRPLGTITCKARYALVMGNRMRMLRVSEYAAAMGFPPGYRFLGTLSDQVECVGNAVCPAVAAHVIREALS